MTYHTLFVTSMLKSWAPFALSPHGGYQPDFSTSAMFFYSTYGKPGENVYVADPISWFG